METSVSHKLSDYTSLSLLYFPTKKTHRSLWVFHLIFLMAKVQGEGWWDICLPPNDPTTHMILIVKTFATSGSLFTLQVDLLLTIIMVLWDALTSGTAEIWRHSVPLPRKGNHNSISIFLLGKGNYNWGKIILRLNYHQQPCDVEETEFRWNIENFSPQ